MNTREVPAPGRCHAAMPQGRSTRCPAPGQQVGWGQRCFAKNPSPAQGGNRVVGLSHRVLELSGLPECKTAGEEEAVMFLT